jgi:hypothetical protein
MATYLLYTWHVCTHVLMVYCSNLDTNQHCTPFKPGIHRSGLAAGVMTSSLEYASTGGLVYRSTDVHASMLISDAWPQSVIIFSMGKATWSGSLQTLAISLSDTPCNDGTTSHTCHHLYAHAWPLTPFTSMHNGCTITCRAMRPTWRAISLQSVHSPTMSLLLVPHWQFCILHTPLHVLNCVCCLI